MTLADKLLGEVGDDPLRAAVHLRRHAFSQRRNLGDFHRASLQSMTGPRETLAALLTFHSESRLLQRRGSASPAASATFRTNWSLFSMRPSRRQRPCASPLWPSRG